MLKKRAEQIAHLPPAEAVYNTLVNWMVASYTPIQDQTHEFLFSTPTCANKVILGFVKEAFEVGEGWHFNGYEPYDCDIMPTLQQYLEDKPAVRTGGKLFRFIHPDGRSFNALHITMPLHDADLSVVFRALVAVPEANLAQWLAFETECKRIENSSLPYRGKVCVIGGQETTFDTHVSLDEIYLPKELKSDILNDIAAFFERGVSIYQRLSIKPFRKLLLAGVPGTGKTMLCSALARWGLDQDYFVAYVSGSNSYGARFWKIHQALEMAASSETRAIVIVEELDAYLQDDDAKAELLNVLDGLESPTNPHGTLLVATTNHPEKIDDRVLKRPGRLDRIFIVPEMDDQNNAETMLRKYMGEQWRDDHAKIVPQLLGKPGAFIREVALYALTMTAYRKEENVTLTILEESLNKLNIQIEAKDDFLTAHKRSLLGFSGTGKRSGLLD